MPPAESSPTSAQAKYPASCGLMHAVADLLIPLFTSPTVSIEFAQKVARSALDDYRPETGPDYVNAARTLAFSMAALALLGQACAPDLALTEKMRLFGRATALNRSADQSERTMMQRRRLQDASPPAEIRPAAPEPEPADGATRIAEAMALFHAARAQEPAPPESPEPPEPRRIDHLPSSPIRDAPSRPQPTHHVAAAAGADPRSNPPRRDRPSLAGQNATPDPLPHGYRDQSTRQTQLRQ